METNSREVAMNWWNGMQFYEKQMCADMYNESNKFPLRHWGDLTGREIEALYSNIKDELFGNLTSDEKLLIEAHRRGSRAIWWGIADFESKAKDIEEDEGTENMFDRSKFADALETIIQSHDANYGIDWNTIESILYSHCQNV